MIVAGAPLLEYRPETSTLVSATTLALCERLAIAFADQSLACFPGRLLQLFLADARRLERFPNGSQRIERPLPAWREDDILGRDAAESDPCYE